MECAVLSSGDFFFNRVVIESLDDQRSSSRSKLNKETPNVPTVSETIRLKHLTILMWDVDFFKAVKMHTLQSWNMLNGNKYEYYFFLNKHYQSQ